MNPVGSRQAVASATPGDSELLARQVAGLSQLLSLLKESRHALELSQLGFVVVNETLRLVPYHQALFWLQPPQQKQQLIALSGVAQWDAHAPQLVWMDRFLAEYGQLEVSQSLHAVDPQRLSEGLRAEWTVWSHPQLIWLPLHHPLRQERLGVLLLGRDQPWETTEQRLLEQLLDGYAQALTVLLPLSRRAWRWHWPRRGWWLKGVAWLVLLVLAMMPVRQSVLAPASVAARQPLLVAAPMDGVVQRFHVVPNETVVTGAPLFDLDPTELQGRFQVATEELAIAKAQYQKSANKAFQSAESAGELAALRAAMARAAAQAEHAGQLLHRLQVRAEMAGVVLFADVNQWLGRPVRVGERILSIADPTDREIEILLPVADALVLQPGAETRLFLHTDPLHPLPGRLRYASYEAAATPEGVLAYRLRSTLLLESLPASVVAQLRLGLKGTAKLFGEEVPLFYYLFRRPLAALRQTLGF
ncbi:MAG: HlyD family efflux transporter periplasmic adaptor subunit [Magnetococcales bacterium]|nr:HlyD family efflux transporter periplasmic adaptor subunit [Magnetococcales bacterium]